MTLAAPGGPDSGSPAAANAFRDSREIALVDLLDRLLAGGVVLTGDITISLAGVDLVQVSLRAIISSIQADTAQAANRTAQDRTAQDRSEHA